jgi:serine/threonine-protein kinase RsbW
MQNHDLYANIIDHGQAFDGPPEMKKMANPEGLDLLDLPEGGFGWFMIGNLCKEISFVRENDRNKLTLILSARPMVAT